MSARSPDLAAVRCRVRGPDRHRNPFPGKISDIIMLVTENGLERTEAEFGGLLGKAGFK
ncbi:MAG: methyltransferase, partial [Candidatus Zixiibacteriota bacterium]